MRTPGEDRFLCAGFLLTEGIIDSVDDIETIELTEQGDVGQAKIRLRAGCHPDPRRLERNIYTHSSCGVCSKPTLESIQVQAPSLENQPEPYVRARDSLPAAAVFTQSAR